jgi:N-acetylglucosamine-6-phosphate deacetylase
MQTVKIITDEIGSKNASAFAVDCINGDITKLVFQNGMLTEIVPGKCTDSNLSFVGPGLIDLQVNGINGIDFNNADLTVQEVTDATYYLLSQGVTTFLPTVITNSEDSICSIVSTICKACSLNTLVNDCIFGIHLEGPFLSAVTGAKGAHNEAYLTLPDWSLFEKFQQAAGGRIKLVTIAPELEGAIAFIGKCSEQKIMVSIGHSMANSEQIQLAVDAGASMATHLGNGVPLLLPRHPNVLWDLLANEQLAACIIADGVHIPDSFIKVVMRTKSASTIVVSDATCFAGMPPGEYKNHIGGTVILDANKRVSMKSEPGLLAGAAKTLLENVETLLDHELATLGEAWKMASLNVTGLFDRNKLEYAYEQDRVIFEVRERTIHVQTVIKKGKIVFEQ